MDRSGGDTTNEGVKGLSTPTAAEKMKTTGQNFLLPADGVFDVEFRKAGKPSLHVLDQLTFLHRLSSSYVQEVIAKFEKSGMPILEKVHIRSPENFSFRSRFRTWMWGHRAPYTRHDLTVSNNGRSSQYIVEYYPADNRTAADPFPDVPPIGSFSTQHFFVPNGVEGKPDVVKNLGVVRIDSTPGYYVDVRPALHSSLSMKLKDWFAYSQPFSGWD